MQTRVHQLSTVVSTNPISNANCNPARNLVNFKNTSSLVRYARCNNHTDLITRSYRLQTSRESANGRNETSARVINVEESRVLLGSGLFHTSDRWIAYRSEITKRYHRIDSVFLEKRNGIHLKVSLVTLRYRVTVDIGNPSDERNGERD